MSHKLLNERIVSAINEYKNKEGWASIEDRNFTRKIFSGKHSAKDLDWLKDFIKRHNQIFSWKENGTSFLVKKKDKQKKKGSTTAFRWKRLFRKMLIFIKELLGLRKKRRKHKKTSATSNSLQQSNLALQNYKENSNNKPKSKPNEKSERTYKPKQQEQNKQCGAGGVSNKPKHGVVELSGNPIRSKKEPQKRNDSGSRALHEKKNDEFRLSAFASFTPYNAYVDACNKLIPTLSENVFATSLEGDFDVAKVNLLVYLAHLFTIRYRNKEVAINSHGATFHTGLFNSENEPIYMLFLRNNENGKEQSKRYTSPLFRFDRFVVRSNNEQNSSIDTLFPSLPQLNSPLTYTSVQLQQLVFDASLPIQKEASNEFLKSNLFYLPTELLETIPALENFKPKFDELKGAKKVAYMKQLANDAQNNYDAFEQVAHKLQMEIEKGLEKARLNPLSLIPGIDTNSNEIVFVMPIFFSSSGIPQLVALVSFMNNSYSVTSLSTLSKATLMIRLLASLPENWISTQQKQ